MTTISTEALYSIFTQACKVSDDILTPAPNIETQTALNKLFSDNGYTNPGWQVLKVNNLYTTGYYDSDGTGFQATAFGLDTNGDGDYTDACDQIVIAYRGTDSSEDILITDLQILLGEVPNQVASALTFYDSVIDEYCTTESEDDGTTIVDKSKLTITGHSLGGALAQLVGAKEGNATITFNAPGMYLQAQSLGYTYSNVVNYVNMSDVVGCCKDNTNGQKHIGQTLYYLPDGMVGDDFKPHSDYVAADFSKYIELSGWTEKYSAALFCYDKNNDNTAQVAGVKTLTGVDEADLKEAVEIVQKKLGETSLLATTMHYSTLTNDYIIGDKEGTELTGSDSKLGVGGNDIIWGNSGNDTINGLSGNDTIYGGAGNDSILGGSGKDYIDGGEGRNTLIGGSGVDTYIANSNDVIIDTDGYGCVSLKTAKPVLQALRSSIISVQSWKKNQKIAA